MHGIFGLKKKDKGQNNANKLFPAPDVPYEYSIQMAFNPTVHMLLSYTGPKPFGCISTSKLNRNAEILSFQSNCRYCDSKQLRLGSAKLRSNQGQFSHCIIFIGKISFTLPIKIVTFVVPIALALQRPTVEDAFHLDQNVGDLHLI